MFCLNFCINSGQSHGIAIYRRSLCWKYQINAISMLDPQNVANSASKRHHYRVHQERRLQICSSVGAYYMWLTGTSLDCYQYLEPLLNDFRKIRTQDREGTYHLLHMDEFVIQLLREERVCDVQLPRLQKRHVLEENNELEPRVSLLEADDLDAD